MAGTDVINLISKESAVSEQVRQVDLHLKQFAVLCLIALVIASVVTLSVYLVLDTQQKSLNNSKNRLIKQLKELSKKENMYLVVKSRIGLTENIINSSKALGPFMEKFYNISPPPNLGSLSYEPDGNANTSYTVKSVEDLAIIASQYAALNESGEIQKTMLNGFKIDSMGIGGQFTFISY